MQEQQAQVDAVCREMDKTREAMTKASVAIKTAARNTKKCQDKVNSLEKEVEEKEKRIKEVQETLTGLEEEAKEVIQHQEELRVREGVGGGGRGVGEVDRSELVTSWFVHSPGPAQTTRRDIETAQRRNGVCGGRRGGASGTAG